MEKTVTVTCVAAIALWALTFAFILAGTAVGLMMGHDHAPASLALIAHGLACSAAAATVSIRLMLQKHYRLLRDAFQLGQDSVGGEPLRRLR